MQYTGSIYSVLPVRVSLAMHIPPDDEVPYRPAVDDDDQGVAAVEAAGLQGVCLEELYSAGILYILPMCIHPEHGFRLTVPVHLQPKLIICNRIKQTLI